jgi:hypothetical protein
LVDREHRIEGVGAETFVRLLRFAYGNGLYDPIKSALENRAFLAMLDTLQITTFGRNHVRNPACVSCAMLCACACAVLCACVCGVCAYTQRALAAHRDWWGRE